MHLTEKRFPNGTKTVYRYDRKDQLTELIHQDREGILDRYTYRYDVLGNKTGITKERRGLAEESGHYLYGYDALGRLSEIQKDGQMQTRYGYDAFGNRIYQREGGSTTTYTYNALNQLVKEKHGELLRAYSYDKRGNLTGIQENGAWEKQYVYGAINRLEEAVDVAAYEENRERNYYLQDELGSPLRIQSRAGETEETYGYGAFGEDLYQNQGKLQPFSMNRYSYCFNVPLVLVDLDGAWPKWIENVAKVVTVVGAVVAVGAVVVGTGGLATTVVAGAAVGGVVSGVANE